LQDAWLHLFSFPEPPDDDDPDDDNPDSALQSGSANQNANGQPYATTAASYPIREMMILVENIAARQVRLSSADWPMWCKRLEQVLIQAKDCDVAQTFRQIGLNPFCPLFAKAFRPEFAEDDKADPGKIYVKALGAVVGAWGLEKATKLGGSE
jgi:hypothetical protein